VLSRVAESLYWVGRYVERAEDTARLLDVHVVGQLDNPWTDLESSARDMLLVMGLDVPDGVLDPAAAATRLAFERGSTSSIAGALEAARDGSRGVREALSSEVWECLNATYHALPGQEASAVVRGPHPFCRWVRERAAVFAGLLDGSMPRDDSWRFLVLGRSLERVDMTARLLRARAVQSGTSSDWVGLLRCCSAHEAYLRGYRAAVEPERVVEFLVLDRLFPRSVYAALAQAERCLVDLDPSAGRTGLVDDARRLLGRARTDLEYRTSDELLHELPELLDMLQRTVSSAGDALSSRYFHRGAAHSWTAEVDA
jgi:uncharacterized alpha-E superfamily protein